MLTKHFQKHKKLFSIHFLLLLCILLSCSEDTEDKAKNSNRNFNNNTSTFIYNAIPENSKAAISSEYSIAVNTFSVNLLKQVYNDENYLNKNLVLSPFSVSRNLAVLTEGTTGESKQELLDALGGQTALDDAKDALSQLLYADNSVILQCADAIWIDSTRFSLKASFREKVISKYGVETAGLNFSDVSGTVNTINKWTSNNTNNFINQIINQDDINQSPTVAILANAIYFEADWTSPFDITKTEKQDFYAPTGVVNVDMMKSSYFHETYKNDKYENAKLYYGTNDKKYFYLDIYMPTTISVQDFVENNSLSALSTQHSLNYGNLQMPKFFFETEVKLIPMLKELGIKGIFDPSKNEITEMIDGLDTGLFVSKVKHKAGIKTDEEGTKAYAVTASVGVMSSGFPSPEVVFNSPFIYFIRAGKNGLILFAGIVNNPNETF